jgi:hypothetical protein
MSKWIFESDGESFIAFRDDGTWQLLQFKDAQSFPLRAESADEADTVDLFFKKLRNKDVQNLRPFPRQPGEFHPRIWRPGNCPTWILAGGPSRGSEKEGGETVLRRSVIAAEVLVSQLKTLFRTVEPDTDNLNAFGQEIRNVLLLACMEAESAWTGILRANEYFGYDSDGKPTKRLSTRDYVKLASPMMLKKYSVSMIHYPQYPKITPFEGWDVNEPSKSLPWYQAYNTTKHDRESSFKVATLKMAIEAVSAVLCLLFAQFGPGNDRLTGWGQGLWQDFRVSIPHSSFKVEEYYAHWRRARNKWKRVNQTF